MIILLYKKKNILLPIVIFILFFFVKPYCHDTDDLQFGLLLFFFFFGFSFCFVVALLAAVLSRVKKRQKWNRILERESKHVPVASDTKSTKSRTDSTMISEYVQGDAILACFFNLFSFDFSRAGVALFTCVNYTRHFFLFFFFSFHF